MSKRKNRKNSAPNLPQETLDRARREAGLEPEPAGSPAEAPPAEPESEVEAVQIAPPRQRPSETARPVRRSDQLPAAQQNRRRRKEVAYEEMTQEEVIYLLEHPTKQVGEDELRQQYGYVMADLRNMALLAAALFVALIVVAGVVVVG